METQKKVFLEHIRGVFPQTYLRSFSDTPAELGVTAMKCMAVRTEMRGIKYNDKMCMIWECVNIDYSRLFKSYLN